MKLLGNRLRPTDESLLVEAEPEQIALGALGGLNLSHIVDDSARASGPGEGAQAEHKDAGQQGTATAPHADLR